MAGTWRCTDNGLVPSDGEVVCSSESLMHGATTFIDKQKAIIIMEIRGANKVIAQCNDEFYIGNTVDGWVKISSYLQVEELEEDHDEELEEDPEDTEYSRFFRSKTFKIGNAVINIFRQGGKFYAKLHLVDQQIGGNPYNAVKHRVPEVEHEGYSIEGLLKLLKETQFIELRYCQVYHEVFTTSGFVRHCRMNLPDRMICYGCGKHHSKHKQWKKCCGIRK